MPIKQSPRGPIEFPDDMSEQEIAAVLSREFPDDKTGAPMSVRAIVGASPEQDRLANLQRFYPQAEAIDGDNFKYLDPEKGRWVTYNPPGPDIGDVASVGKEIAQTAGGLAAGTAAVVGANPWFSPLVGAVGSQAAGNAYQEALSKGFGMIDTRTPGQRVAETVGGTAAETLFGRAGNAFMPAVVNAFTKATRMAGGINRTATDLYNDFIGIGARPSADIIGQSAPAHVLGRGLAGSVFGGKTMQESDEALLDAVKSEAERVASSYGQVLDPEVLGATIRGTKGATRATGTGAEGYLQRFDLAAEKKYRDVGRLIPSSVKMFPANTYQFAARRGRDTLARQLPNTSPSLRNPKVNAMLDDLMADFRRRADDGQFVDTRLSFKTLQRLRSRIGKIMGDPVAYPDFDRAELNGLYSAVSRDMEALANRAGPQATQAWRRANEFYARHMKKNVEPLNKILDKKLDQDVYRLAMSGTDVKGGGAGQLRLLRRTLKPEEWDAVVGTTLGRMGRAKPGMQNADGDAFSADTFMTQYGNLSDAAKRVMFESGRYSGLRPQLDRLVRIMQQMKETQKAINTSNTSRHEQVSRLMTAASLSAVGLAGMALGEQVDNPGLGIAGGLASYYFAPKYASKLLTSQTFVKWLADSASSVPKANGWGENIGRLIGIAEADPEIREEIYQYVAALRRAPKPAELQPSKKPPR